MQSKVERACVKAAKMNRRSADNAGGDVRCGEIYSQEVNVKWNEFQAAPAERGGNGTEIGLVAAGGFPVDGAAALALYL